MLVALGEVVSIPWLPVVISLAKSLYMLFPLPGHHMGSLPTSLYSKSLSAPIQEAFFAHSLQTLVLLQQPPAIDVLSIHCPLPPSLIFLINPPQHSAQGTGVTQNVLVEWINEILYLTGCTVVAHTVGWLTQLPFPPFFLPCLPSLSGYWFLN